MCVAGENAHPPENVGGPPGYDAFREAIAERQHPEFADYWHRIGTEKYEECTPTIGLN